MFLFKKSYYCSKPFPHLSWLIQTKNGKFFKVTDDLNTNKIEVYKYKDGTLDIEYAIWNKNFKNSKEAFKYLGKEQV